MSTLGRRTLEQRFESQTIEIPASHNDSIRRNSTLVPASNHRTMLKSEDQDTVSHRSGKMAKNAQKTVTSQDQVDHKRLADQQQQAIDE